MMTKQPVHKAWSILIACISFFLSVTLFPARVQAQSTDPNFKVAFIGDSGAGSNFQSVLNLIKGEGAQLVLHQGDYGYSASAATWAFAVNNVLGPNFPYLGSDGNHEDWADYAPFMKDRLSKMGLDPNVVPTTKSSYSVVYKGLKMVFSAENGDPTFIQQALAGDSHTWKVCSWHKNMTAMQVGGKGNEQGWGDYENCRQQGAIIATAHEHTYHRTKTLTSTQSQTVDTSQHPLQNGVPGNSNQVIVKPGKTFVFVSGLGGNGKTRVQQRCLPYTYPYGGGTECNYIWASIFTGSQTPQTQPPGPAEYGALFITFNYQGNPNKAHAYFKTIQGQIVDEFDIFAGSGIVGPTNTPTPISSTPPVGGKPGDANSDGKVDGLDYVIWLNHYNQNLLGAINGDFNNSGKVDGLDYVIWLNSYKSSGGVTPTPTTPGQAGELDIAVCAPNKGPFSLNITNPFYPLPVGLVHIIEDATYKIQFSVLNQTELVAGVTNRIVEEREWKNGSLIEVSRNFFVQAPDGTVCYYGEDVDEYSSGQIVGHGGAWRAGVGQNKPGIIMPANPAVGQTYYQEYAPGVAMDRAEHTAMGQTFTTPAGTFSDVLVVKETPPSDKKYQRGLGMIYDDGAVLTQY